MEPSLLDRAIAARNAVLEADFNSRASDYIREIQSRQRQIADITNDTNKYRKLLKELTCEQVTAASILGE